ncbi:major facilitator superfamily domain-containing protein [Pseudomassariella vexata]|uniref:Major facilitator superfamily domain-containing protein n=1 Tax=Pseudomassariella vexata TaxID=1141098 RepID=A0A1Y2DNW5_9PEZI|nr:major facilitator superfamily domain-containing protein [Pseudomassariella vexata]ORY60973.1 major facilitator superfamily domain-containing protein [Pseudomassariella vexata]
MTMAGDNGQNIDPIVAARALRKLDWFFIPITTIGNGLVWYDKAILGSAAILGMVEDLELSTPDQINPVIMDTSRLSWATSLFYFGMLAGVYPISFILQRFDTGRVLGTIVCMWSLTCMITAAITSYQGLYAQRFVLGFIESAVPTAFSTLISTFYTQQEQPFRQSWWVSAVGPFAIIGGSLNYGFAHITGGDLHSWQYIYLLAGTLTFIFGLFCFDIPSSPASAWFLSDEEKAVTLERLKYGHTGTGFGPLIVRNFGWTSFQSILLQFPIAAFSFLSSVMAGFFASRYSNIRILILIGCCVVVIASCVIVWKSNWAYHAAAPIIGYTMGGALTPFNTMVISLGLSNVAGYTKKSFASATIFVAYCIGNIIGPLMIRTQTRASHYPELWTGLIICYSILICAAATYYVLLRRANRMKQSAQGSDEGAGDNDESTRVAFLDRTDKENVYFRYVL